MTLLALVVAVVASAFGPRVERAYALSFTVTTTADAGVGSLRQALTDANTTPGPIVIGFSIPGSGVHTIAPASALPTLGGNIVIDGYTQSGATSNSQSVGNDAVILIELNGANAGTGTDGIVFDGSDNAVRGLAINRFDGASIRFRLGANNRIEGNVIGLNAAGTTVFPYDSCVLTVPPYTHSTCNGVVVGPTSDGATIGGPSPAARNVITGNGTNYSANISIEYASYGRTTIQGNYIGTDRTGQNVQEGTYAYGIKSTEGRYILIGGNKPGTGNVIAGWNIGISLDGNSLDTVIQGNRLGTNAQGTATIGTAITNINISEASDGNLVGTDSDGVDDNAEGNLIAGASAFGVYISESSGTLLRGNIIGAPDGSPNIGGNTHGIGIIDATNTVVGTNGDGVRDTIEGNTIARNYGYGIWLQGDTSLGNSIRGNRIYDNSENIRFGFGAEPNDPDDADTGPNGSQNWPDLVRTANIGNEIVIAGRLNSAPNTTYALDFYSASTCSATYTTGGGEGGGIERTVVYAVPAANIYLGSATRTTDSTGAARFTVRFAGTVGINDFVTATATDSNGNTSVMGECGSGGPGNDTWPDAYELPTLGGVAAPGVTVETTTSEIVTTIKQRIDIEGGSRWYRFRVLPGETLRIEAYDLPVNYDLVVYNDVKRSYDEVLNPTVGAPSYLLARQEVESSPNGVYTGPNGVYTGPNGVYTGPNGVYTGPNGVYTGAGSVDTYPDLYVNNLVTDNRLSPEVAVSDGLQPGSIRSDHVQRGRTRRRCSRRRV